jgi:hypothetical protein
MLIFFEQLAKIKLNIFVIFMLLETFFQLIFKNYEISQCPLCYEIVIYLNLYHFSFHNQ